MPNLSTVSKPLNVLRRHAFPLLRLKRFWATFLVSLLIVLIVGPRVIGGLIARKFKREVEARLNATFSYGSAEYLLPYGLRIDDATLTTRLPGVGPTPVLQIGRVELHLIKFPLGSGPVLIDRVNIRKPIVRLLQLPDGMLGRTLASGNSTASDGQSNHATGATATPAVAATKLSDLFRLNRLSIEDGSLQFEDHTAAPTVAPVTWAAIRADLKLAPVGPGLYEFDIAADHAPLAAVKIHGDLDVDSLLLHLTHLTMNVEATAARPPVELPTPLRKLGERFAIGGNLSLTGSATVPLDAPSRGYYVADLKLKDGTCRVDGFDRPLSPVRGNLHFSNMPDAPFDTVNGASPEFPPPAAVPVQVGLRDFAIDCDQQFLHIDHATGSLDPTSRTWTLRELTGMIDVGHGAGPVATAHVWSRLPFTAAGAGHFSADDPYWALVTIIDGQTELTDHALPLRHINVDLYATPGKVQAQRLEAQVLSGTLKGNAIYNSGATPSYSGEVALAHADVHQAAVLFVPDERDRQRFSGSASLRTQFGGDIPRNAPHAGIGSIQDRLTASGKFDVRHGDFYQIPMLKDVVTRMKLPNAADVGEVAATFDIRHQQVNFYNVAANSDAAGVQGNGTINFAGIADMTLIATPLSDWREKLQNTKVKYLNDIGAEIAGKAQSGFNTMQRVALYQFRLTGPLANPVVKTVPFPVETTAMKSAFQKMAQLRDQAR